MKAIAELKQGLGERWKSIAEGWDHVRQRAGNAMTRYKRDRAPANLPRTDDDDFLLASPNWGLLAGEVFEDRDKVVVRLEAPGMEEKDFDLTVEGDMLRVRGEKRSQRESGDGAWRMMECAYGSFERSIRLPAEVRVEKAKATYKRGVLRIELPKVEAKSPSRVKVKVK